MGARSLRLAALLCVACGCMQQSYPPPNAEPAVPLRPRGRDPIDSGDAERVAAMARACQARTSAATVTLALDARERLRAALAPHCEVRTLDAEPLRIHAHCSVEVAAPASGGSHATTDKQCKAVVRNPAHAAGCAGAALRSSLAGVPATSWPGIEMLVASAADWTDPIPADFDACFRALDRLGQPRDPAWPAADPGAQGEARVPQLGALAQCRAALFAASFRDALGARSNGRTASVEPALELAILTTGPQGPEPAPSTSSAAGGHAQLDVVLQLVPEPDASLDACGAESSDLASTLQCLERCARQNALVRVGEARASVALPSLFDSPYRNDELLSAADVRLTEVHATPERHLGLTRACALLGYATPACRALTVQNLGGHDQRDNQSP